MATPGARVAHADGVVLRRGEPADAAAIADVYLRSFRAALPHVRLAHTDDEVRGWVRDRLVALGVEDPETWVAAERDRVIGMLVVSPGWIEQLYVDPERRGEGVGRRLLDLAARRAPGPLELWTFQANAAARRFYARNGFVEVELTDGRGNEEREPDVRLRREAGWPGPDPR